MPASTLAPGEQPDLSFVRTLHERGGHVDRSRWPYTSWAVRTGVVTGSSADVLVLLRPADGDTVCVPIDRVRVRVAPDDLVGHVAMAIDVASAATNALDTDLDIGLSLTTEAHCIYEVAMTRLPSGALDERAHHTDVWRTLLLKAAGLLGRDRAWADDLRALAAALGPAAEGPVTTEVVAPAQTVAAAVPAATQATVTLALDHVIGTHSEYKVFLNRTNTTTTFQRALLEIAWPSQTERLTVSCPACASPVSFLARSKADYERRALRFRIVGGLVVSAVVVFVVLIVVGRMSFAPGLGIGIVLFFLLCVVGVLGPTDIKDVRWQGKLVHQVNFLDPKGKGGIGPRPPKR